MKTKIKCYKSSGLYSVHLSGALEHFTGTPYIIHELPFVCGILQTFSHFLKTELIPESVEMRNINLN